MAEIMVRFDDLRRYCENHHCGSVPLEYIKQMRTVEAEPVRHGRWKGWTRSCFTGKYKDYDEPEFKDYKYYQCSECYRKSAIRELYCPQCGAKMQDGCAETG